MGLCLSYKRIIYFLFRDSLLPLFIKLFIFFKPSSPTLLGFPLYLIVFFKLYEEEDDVYLFTGLVEEIGTINNIHQNGQTLVIAIKANKILSDIQLGDSIAVNGVCLTVTNFSKNHFEVDVMPETFNDTTLRFLKVGSKVNLERALAANGRFGGHFVTGHTDGIGTIRKRSYIENAILIEIEIPEEFNHLLIEKGSIAIDGTSLTIFKSSQNTITISLIPHTAKASILGSKREGEKVNLEFDMMAKYFYSFMQNKSQTTKSKGITIEFLKENGF